MFDLFSFTDNRDALFAAIVKAQSEMSGISKDSANPFFRSKYASLPAVLEAITPVLNRNGLAMLQLPTFDGDNTVQVTTVIIHTSGQMMSSTVGAPIPSEDAVVAHDPKDKKAPPKRDPQAVGSAITYLRRYAAQSIFALPVEDDDGNAASRRPSAPPAAPTPAPKVGPVGTATGGPKPGKVGNGAMKVINEIKALLEENGLKVADFNVWADKGGRPHLDAMDLGKLQACRDWLEKGGCDTIMAALVAK